MNRDDRWNNFFSDRSYHMETGLRKWSVNEQNLSLICDWEKSYSFQSDPAFLNLPPANLLHKHQSAGCYKAFSHDVTAAILVFQNNERAAMLVC